MVYKPSTPPCDEASASAKTPGTRPSACCRCCRSHLPSVQRTANLRLRTGAGEGENRYVEGLVFERRAFAAPVVRCRGGSSRGSCSWPPGCGSCPGGFAVRDANRGGRQ